MNSTATAVSLLSENLILDRALVVEDERADGTIQVQPETGGPVSTLTAHVAISRTAPLASGDRVLLAGNSEGDLYVIGKIGPFQPEAQYPAALKTGDGACALLAESPNGDGVLKVYSPRKELIFEYDPAGQKARVHIPQGSLELSTEEGDIELRSARNVLIGGRAIEMDSRELNVRADSSCWAIDRLVTLAGTLVEKARNAYRTVEQLSQLRTGRMRTLVDQTFQFKSRKAFLKSEEDFKIKGEKIHLG